MADTSLKLIYLLQELGEYSVVPDGSIVTIGGVIGPNFTVGGKPLLFADGTATDGSKTSALNPDFQKAYDNSKGEAFVDFTSGKDFVLQAVNNNQFRFDADTGDITITGNLNILGNSSSVIHTTLDSDRVEIHQSAGSYTPFIMEPIGGVTPQVNVVDIKVAAGGASVFTISPTGQTFIKDLSAPLVNGIDLTALAARVNAHLSPTGIKHTAAQISVDSHNLGAVHGDTVQAALESIATSINTMVEHEVSGVRGFEYAQVVESSTWTIIHDQDTRRVHMTIWDSDDEQVFADTVEIFDQNSIVVRFSTPMTGRAILMLF